jgi:lipopolysaccharide export system protein LptC
MMAQPVDRYSRRVAWLKVILPLMALAILSTLFLLSRQIDPTAAIPFGGSEIEERLPTQQITEPFFSGTTAQGDQLSFTADTMQSTTGGGTVAEGLSAEIEYVSGAWIDVQAGQGAFRLTEQLIDLSGGVSISTNTGYAIQTEAVSTQLEDGTMIANQTVMADGPGGQITSGGFMATSSGAGKTNQLLFTNGVKLIYDPKTTER